MENKNPFNVEVNSSVFDKSEVEEKKEEVQKLPICKDEKVEMESLKKSISDLNVFNSKQVESAYVEERKDKKFWKIFVVVSIILLAFLIYSFYGLVEKGHFKSDINQGINLEPNISSTDYNNYSFNPQYSIYNNITCPKLECNCYGSEEEE